jgi:hypothetical protein
MASPQPKNQPQQAQVGRRIRELPETHHANYLARQARRHEAAQAKIAADLAAERADNAKLKDMLHEQEVAAYCNERPHARTDDDRKKLRLTVERARRDWCKSGRQGVFDWLAVAKRAEFDLGFVAVPPVPKASPQNALGASSPEVAAQARATRAAYERRLRELGLDVPGQGSSGDFRRPF